jgi:beta-glucosidase
MDSHHSDTAAFPLEFTWGAATSSYQIEGAWDQDGKGESIWDRFCHTPGHIDGGQTGDVACDHYHRWREDIEIMRGMGIQAYRFSVSWPRIFPLGAGQVNQAGLDFYSALVDGLLEAGIEPYVNLYHWELPQALQDQGGWPARATAEAFATYAETVSQALGDRVDHWITLNEPFVSAYIGYYEGRHAPGHQDLGEMIRASHHLLLAHGWSVPLIRSNAPGADVAIVLNLHPMYAASSSEADERARRRRDGIINRWYLDPLAGRGYPQDIVEYYGVSQAHIQPGDMAAIAAPLDYLGINYYTRMICRSDEIPEDQNRPREISPAEKLTDMGWEVYPDGLFEILEYVDSQYDFPALMITENGAAFPDKTGADHKVNDPQRIEYLAGHVHRVARALEAGIPVTGYFAWSLLDNFEWSFGYSKRFGLVYVDFDTLERIPKASAGWYRTLITERRLPAQG